MVEAAYNNYSLVPSTFCVKTPHNSPATVLKAQTGKADVLIACTKGSSDICMWNLSSLSLKLVKGHSKPVLDLVLVTPDCEYCMSLAEDEMVGIWKIDTEPTKLLQMFKCAVEGGAAPRKFATSGDFRIIMTADARGEVNFWNVLGVHKYTMSLPHGYGDTVTHLKTPLENKATMVVYTAGIDGKIAVSNPGNAHPGEVDCGDGPTTRVVESMEPAIRTVGETTENYLVTGCRDGMLYVWKLTELKQDAAPKLVLWKSFGIGPKITQLAVPKGMPWIACGFQSGVKLWNPWESKVCGEITISEGEVTSMCVDEQGSSLFVGISDGSIRGFSVAAHDE